jgi:peptidoglycan/xylan/chitin deacetylase (PgdA/CDA1 family)/uncharacterized caspase-like protein
MHTMRLLPWMFALLGAWTLTACDRAQPPAAPTVAVSAAPSLVQQMRSRADELLAAHRQMIVLMSDERSLDAPSRRAVGSVGQMLFHDMQLKQEALLDLASKTADPGTVPALQALLERVESEPSWFDADRLAFKEFLTRLVVWYANAQSLPGLKLARRAADDVTVLSEIEAAYDSELKDIFGRFAQRGIEPKREKWADYVAKLRALYTREQILKDYATIVPYPQPSASGAASGVMRGAGKEAAKEADAREIFGTSLPPKTVVLTFDDGPHPRYTDEILEILRRYQVSAIFFHLGRNLGQTDAAGHAVPGAQMAVAKRVLAAGHMLANHSYSHGVMAKLPSGAVRDEATHTEDLLSAAGRAPTAEAALFRFPYGARNEGALATVEALKLRSMMWSVDSMDWADPVPKSIAERVLSDTRKAQRGVILFHDIQGRTVQALPLVLDQLVADGYRFATWQGGKFVVSPAQAPARETGLADAGDTLYRQSHALIIGIDKYTRWPALQYAVRDAKAVQEQLVSRLGFKAENVTLLLDEQATRANILQAFNGKLADAKQVQRDDRVMVFYAGHGGTRKLASGRDVGYLIPVDAPLADFASDAVSMPQLQEVAEATLAKHVLFIIDACYSGLGLTRGGNAGVSKNFLADNARRQGRQMMTAGGADQQVADDGPGGHSAFTWTLLQALSGKADLNGDGVITGTELAAYVAPAVAAIARQTPAFGNLAGSEGGEFIFELPPERDGLSAETRQLDPDASRLALRIAAAQTPATAASAPSVRVKNLDGSDGQLRLPAAAPQTARVAAQRANEQGLALYRERRYDEAEAAFTEALRLQPRFALAANNLGFVYYKRGKPAEAARWFEQAISMDGSRALAYLNLGDARLLAGEDIKAQAAFTTFVALAPRHARAAELQAWLAAPDKVPRPHSAPS